MILTGILVNQKSMVKRGKKRGRPRTGRDPVVGVRLPAARLKQVDKIAAARSCDRSGAIRWLLDVAMDSGVPSVWLRSGKGRNLTEGRCRCGETRSPRR